MIAATAATITYIIVALGSFFRVSHQLTHSACMDVSSLHLLAVDNIVLSTSFITLHEMLFDIEHSALLP